MLYIMRHGKTDWNELHKLQGRTDIPLNEYGIELAKITSDGIEKEGLQFDIIYASPLSRARKTAEIVRGTHTTEIVIDDRIIEMNFGKSESEILLYHSIEISGKRRSRKL